MKYGLLTINDIEPGIQEVSLNLTDVYSDEDLRAQFEERFVEFLGSDCLNSKTFRRRDDTIIYRTECIIPEKQDGRPPLLLVFGNPASHSVASGMFFSYQGDKQEHSIWNVFSKADLLSFPSLHWDKSPDNLGHLMQLRKRALLKDLDYDAPFRVGFGVFYTMPSPAKAGVIALRSVFGKKAFAEIGESEKQRIDEVIRGFVTPDGGVITFQKDAYLGIKSLESPDYELIQAKEGHLIGKCQCDSGIRLFGMPPTRPQYRNLSVQLLQKIKKDLCVN